MGQMIVGDHRGGQWLFSQEEKARLNAFPSVLTQIQSIEKSKAPKTWNGLLHGALLMPDLFPAACTIFRHAFPAGLCSPVSPHFLKEMCVGEQP